MVYLFYTTNISVDLAHHEIFYAKDGKGGIKDNMTHLVWKAYITVGSFSVMPGWVILG